MADSKDYPSLRKLALSRRKQIMGILMGTRPPVEDHIFEGLNLLAWNARNAAIEARKLHLQRKGR